MSIVNEATGERLTLYIFNFGEFTLSDPTRLKTFRVK
jgi:hypothetical protein